MDDPHERLFYAIQSDDTDTLQRLVNHDLINVNQTFVGQSQGDGKPSVWSPLHLCCEKGRHDCAMVLLGAGADPDSQDRYSQTPLVYSVQTEWLNIVQLLIKGGADVNAQDGRGRSALHVALDCSDTKCLKMLIDAGADLNVGDVINRTVLWLAAHDCHVAAVKLLLEAGCDVNQQDCRQQCTALQAVIRFGKHHVHELVRMLLDAGTDVNIYDQRNRNALSDVIRRNWDHKDTTVDRELELGSWILDAGFCINTVHAKKVWPDPNWIRSAVVCGDPHDVTPGSSYEDACAVSLHGFCFRCEPVWNQFEGSILTLAVERGCLAWVELLLTRGADPDILDERGAGSLLMAARVGHLGITRTLLQQNCRLDLPSAEVRPSRHVIHNFTPLRAAIFYGHTDVTQLLVNAGISLDDADYLLTNQDVPESLVKHVELWGWLLEQRNAPRSLLDLSRGFIRRLLRGKLLFELCELIPRHLQRLLLLKDLLECR